MKNVKLKVESEEKTSGFSAPLGRDEDSREDSNHLTGFVQQIISGSNIREAPIKSS